MAEDVAAAVDARPLAVPHRKHPVVFRAGEEVDLLRAPDGGGGEVFIDAWLEPDVMGVEMLFRTPQRLVEPAQRRAAIAGNEAGGVKSGGEVSFPLHHRQAGEGLGAGEVDAAG
jgi:hypothetical protein